MNETLKVTSETVTILADRAQLTGDLSIPTDPIGLVLFAHGSGSGRLSPRNQFVARTLNDHRIATLLFDLLTPDEEVVDAATRRLRFDIGFLALRLVAVTDWTETRAVVAHLPVGYFGASTGAAAALVAAASRPDLIRAVVSRGGRPDLARTALSAVRAPTLLIVGGADPDVISLNEQAFRNLPSRKELVIVDRATHLFEEPGTLEEVARLATSWFERYLGETNNASR
jgi:pimeloyl-ACP methyl ester carboxylesterase